MQEYASDVIIVGGGVAGLSAAGRLSRRGVKVMLIEARDRLGGRVHTVRRPGSSVPVEMGAQFVHGGNKAFSSLLKRHGIKPQRVPRHHWRFAGDGLERVKLEASIAAVTKRIRPRTMKGWSFARFLAERGHQFTELEREMAIGFVEGFNAASLDDMSAVAAAGETLEEDGQFIIPEGYSRVVDALVAELDPTNTRLFVDAPSNAITWWRGGARVRTPQALFNGRAVVVAVPGGVLQRTPGERGAIAFTPALDRHADAVAALGVGHVIRINFRLDGRAWKTLLPPVLRKVSDGGFGFIHSLIGGVPVCWSLSGAPVLTGWSGGPEAAALAAQSDKQIARAALHSVATLLGLPVSALRAAVRDVTTHNWTRDPFSRGAYTFTRAAKEDASERLREPLGNTLFFAGEATADGAEVGTVHGALASGLRAADEVGAVL